MLAALFICSFLDTEGAHAQAVDLALVLVIDNSGSIDPGESALQFNGYAEAFQSHELIKEMTGGPNGAIAVSVLLFSDVVHSVGGWRIIDGPESANSFADLLRSAPYISSGGTHIGQALEAAVMELASCPYPSAAATIDLSGDGPDNEGVALNIASPMELLLAFTGLQTAQWSQEIQNNAYRLRRLRDSIKARGVSINCVAIQDPDLQDYFEKYVICGQGSFAVLASSFQSFRAVIKRKIIREVRLGVRQSVEKSARRMAKPKSPQKKADVPEDGAAAKPKIKEAGLAKTPETSGEALYEPGAGAAETQNRNVGAAAPKRIRKEAVLTLREAETKLPISEAKIILLGNGQNFSAEPNGSLPGQFFITWDDDGGTAISLRVEAPGHTPKEMQVDKRDSERYEVELERLPIRFIL